VRAWSTMYRLRGRKPGRDDGEASNRGGTAQISCASLGHSGGKSRMDRRSRSCISRTSRVPCVKWPPSLALATVAEDSSRCGPMRSILTIAILILLLLTLWDSFEVMVFPRRVMRSFRLTRAFYRYTWRPWRFVGCRIKPGRTREAYLSVYGPLSLLGLFATWVAILIF